MILALILFFQTPFAPGDTTRVLPELNITASAMLQEGATIYQTDSVLTVQSADFLLRSASTEGMRSIGPGALNTVSIRGGGPAHAAIVWEGMNLQSPMNGVYDMSLMPLWPGDALSIQKGGQSAVLGSGAMAGSIRLRSADFSQDDKGGFLSIGAGSFGHFDGAAGFNYGNAAYQGQARLMLLNARNDFPYTNTALIGSPRVLQQNNDVFRMDVQHRQTWQINAANRLSSALWVQKAERGIPAAMTEGASNSRQADEAIRAVINWTHLINPEFSMLHRLALLDEQIHFTQHGQVDDSRSKSLQAAGEYTLQSSNNWRFQVSWTTAYLRAQAEGYENANAEYSQWRSAALAKVEKATKRFHWVMAYQQHAVEHQGTPYSWTLGARAELLPNITLRSQFSRNFTLPTFNDRYWKALGNPDLKSEKGYSSELGMQARHGGFLADVSVYAVWMDDWILWSPGADGLFRPTNLRKVWSRGLELRLEQKGRVGKFQWSIKGQYQFNRSTNQEGAGMVGKQLPYEPLHIGTLRISADFPHWSLNYTQRLTGMRYTTSDNGSSVPAYTTAMASGTFKITDHWRASLLLDNCWNAQYQVLAYRPMPGFNWQLSVLYSW